MDFTREPIIETIITPKEGYKLVIRSSKSAGQEEYFVDSLEVVSFGHAFFFRSMERPKSFLVPVADYEVLEVREARMVLKNVGADRSIKIGGGRDGSLKSTREADKEEATAIEEEIELPSEKTEGQAQPEAAPEARAEVRLDKKRDRRRHYRKRRGSREEREEAVKEGAAAAEPTLPSLEEEKVTLPPPEAGAEVLPEGATSLSSSLLSSLLQPPPTLISETINRYRENALFKNAFFLTEDEQYKPHDKVQELLNEDDEEDFAPSLQEPTYALQEGEGEFKTDPSEGPFLDNPEASFSTEEWDIEVQLEEQEVEQPASDLFPCEQEPDQERGRLEGSSEPEASLSLYAEEDDERAEEKKGKLGELGAQEEEATSNHPTHREDSASS